MTQPSVKSPQYLQPCTDLRQHLHSNDFNIYHAPILKFILPDLARIASPLEYTFRCLRQSNSSSRPKSSLSTCPCRLRRASSYQCAITALDEQQRYRPAAVCNYCCCCQRSRAQLVWEDHPRPGFRGGGCTDRGTLHHPIGEQAEER